MMETTLVQKLINELIVPRCSRKQEPPSDGQCFRKHECCTKCNYCIGKCVGFCRYPPSSKRRNAPLERLCFRIVLKCSFAAAGCEFTGRGMEVFSHEKICDFSLKPCPQNHKNETCSWLGLGKDMKRHCDSIHPGDILKGQVCIISTKVNDFVDNDKTILISAYDTLFSCTWHLCTTLKSAFVSVVYFGQKFKRTRYIYELNIMKECKVTKTLKKFCSHSPGFHKRLLGEYDFLIPLDNLEDNFVVSGKLIYTIKIRINNQATPIEGPSVMRGTPGLSLEEAILAELECPICFCCMSPPINQCMKGHQLCKDCFQLISRCPLCQYGKSESVNYSLAYFYKMVRVPCKNAYNGCDFREKGLDILKHEASCTFDPVKDKNEDDAK